MAEAKLTLNALGWECPRPIIETKRLLDTIPAGQVLTLVDNSVARDNLLDFAQSQGYSAECQEEAGVFHITVTKAAAAREGAAPALRPVILITGDTLGSGAEELGQALLKTYLYALAEAEPQPAGLIFMNQGVFLACEGSAVLDSLEKMAAAGVEILACGACLNFYGLTQALAVGKISNMYDIVRRMNAAANTIRL